MCVVAIVYTYNVLLFYVVGLIISHIFIPVAVDHLTLKHYVIYSLVLLLAGVAIFYALLLLGMDPFWSYYLAKRWCSQPEWIHLNTSLLFALVRDSSSLLGQKYCHLVFLLLCVKLVNWLYSIPVYCSASSKFC